MTANLTGTDVSRDAMRDALTGSGLMPEFAWLRADTLKSPEYQRPLKLGKAKKIARELDPDKFWPLIISRRSDGDYVLDGQHRLHAVREILNWRDQNVPCEIYTGLTQKMEAKLYGTQASDTRSPLTPLERLHSDVIAEVPDAVGLTLTVKRAGLAMDWTHANTEGTLRAATTVRSLYRSRGPAHVLEVLLLLKDTLGTNARVFQSDMITGTSAFLTRYQEHDHYKRAEFIRKVGRAGLDAILQRARQIGTGYSGKTTGSSVHVGRALLIVYNYDRRTYHLPEWEDRIALPAEVEAQRAARIGATMRRQIANGKPVIERRDTAAD